MNNENKIRNMTEAEKYCNLCYNTFQISKQADVYVYECKNPSCSNVKPIIEGTILYTEQDSVVEFNAEKYAENNTSMTINIKCKNEECITYTAGYTCAKYIQPDDLSVSKYYVCPICHTSWN